MDPKKTRKGESEWCPKEKEEKKKVGSEKREKEKEGRNKRMEEERRFKKFDVNRTIKLEPIDLKF